MTQRQQNHKVKYIKQIDYQLKKAGLIRRQFPEAPRNLFKAISDRLYFDQRYSDELVELCKNELKRRINSNNLTSKLSHQFQNKALIEDYYQNPDLSGFTKTHLGLISLAYDRKIIVYYMSQNYLTTMVVNNSSNKHAPILLCRVLNSYSAVLSIQVQNVSQMIKQRICQKLMAHSFLISTKQNNEKISKLIFETPKRTHKKSLSLCDELQYQEIFGAAINFSFQNNNSHSSKFIPFENDDKDDLDLLGECNINGKVQYPVNTKNQIFQLSPPTNFHRAQSMRVISATNIPPQRKQNYELSGGKRTTGRLKFFDQNKNYGFIVMDEDNTDIFVHFDDLAKAGMTKEYMRNTKLGHIIRFQFSSMAYVGKYDKSRKAVQLLLLEATDYTIF